MTKYVFKAELVVKSGSRSKILNRYLQLNFVPNKDILFVVGGEELVINDITYNVDRNEWKMTFGRMFVPDDGFDGMITYLKNHGWSE